MSPIQATLANDSESPPSPWMAFGTLILVLSLSLVGVIGLLTIGLFLPQASEKAYWFISRSSGVVAYVLITLSVLLGLVQSGNLFRAYIAPLLSLGLHSFFSWIGLGLSLLHGIILVGNEYTDFDLPQVFIPFLSDYRPIPVGLGIIAFYLMLLLSLSFYARSYLGQENFRTLHYTSFVAFIAVTAHSLLAGTDSVPLWWMYTGSLVAVLGLTILRIVESQRAKRRALARSVGPMNPNRPPLVPVPAPRVEAARAAQAQRVAHASRVVAQPDRR